MSPVTYLLMASALAAVAAALVSLLFFAWAFIGRRESRNRRLRLSVAGVVVVIAGIGAFLAGFYLVVMPMELTSIPEFLPPYESWRKVLAVFVLLLICSATGVAVWLLVANPVKKKLSVILILCMTVLATVVGAADWKLIYSIQAPAYSRYVMIERREWKTRVGDVAPDIEITMLDGKHVRLSELRGKVVLVNFFATWCGPCKNELPHMQGLWKEFGACAGFSMVVIGREETQESVADFKTKNSYTFPMAIDSDGAAFHKFADESIPRTYLISPEGTILFQSLGFGEGNDVYVNELATLHQIIQSEVVR